MKASFKRRLTAYLIDLVLLSMLISLTLVIFPNDNKIIIENNSKISELSENLLNDKITNVEYLKTYAQYNYNIEKSQLRMSIFNIIYIMFLYILIPIFSKGQTVGKIITRIKVINDDNTNIKTNKIFIRSLFTIFLIYPLIMVPLIYLNSSILYFVISLILTLIEFLLVLFSIFMVLYRHDKKGLHDILTKTKVIKL
jgi:uncharacterized RDD family membrane protein YckC